MAKLTKEIEKEMYSKADLYIEDLLKPRLNKIIAEIIQKINVCLEKGHKWGKEKHKVIDANNARYSKPEKGKDIECVEITIKSTRQCKSCGYEQKTTTKKIVKLADISGAVKEEMNVTQNYLEVEV